MAKVRKALMALHPSGPDVVDSSNYLTLGVHWTTSVHFVVWHATDASAFIPSTDFYIRCIDLGNPGHGEVVGDPEVPRRLLFARENDNHFVPLHRLD